MVYGQQTDSVPIGHEYNLFRIFHYLKLYIYHSITNLGSTRARPDDKLVDLLRSGSDATTVIFNKESVTTEISIQCPTHNTLKAITDATLVKTTAVPTRNRHTLLNAKIKFLPPMISDPFLEITDKDPSQLLVELNAIISAFDAVHDGDTDFSKAEADYEELRHFLWGTANDLVSILLYAPDPDDAELQS